MKKWFTSDTHFSNKNIIDYANRPYETVEEMNKSLIDNWNQYVNIDDQVYFLGDFGHGNVDHLRSICTQLKGHKICIRGDKDRKASDMMQIGFNTVFESAQIKIGFHTVELIHTPSNEPPSHFQLHGHVHGKRPQNLISNQLNLCLEVWDYKPVSEKNILEILDKAQPSIAFTSPKLIAIEDLAFHLGLSIKQIELWLQRDKVIIQKDFLNRSAVPVDLLESYSFSPEYKQAFRSAIFAENKAKQDNKVMYPIFKDKRLKLLKFYDGYIHKLVSLHKKYLGLANGCGYESPEMAALLLFSRVITNLKMFCSSQREDFWYSGSLIREIDESLALAQYFIVYKDKEEGKKNLHKWFRQNDIPGNKYCRKAISDRMDLLTCHEEGNNKKLMDEIYNKKSKFTHPSYAFIRDALNYEITNHSICIKNFEYGRCSNEEKMLELTQFFESSIWTSFQAFNDCFSHLPIILEDRQFLSGINQLFLGRAQKFESLPD